MKVWASIAALVFLCAAVSCGGGAGGTLSSNSPGGSGGGGVSTSLSWQAINTPSGATQLTFFAINSRNHWFLSDRSKGFFRSTDQGVTWTTINNGLATTLGWTINVNPANGDLIASIYSGSSLNANPVYFYRSADEGNTWTMIPSPLLSAATAETGCAFPSNRNIVCGGFWASNPTSGGWVSTNGGQTTASFSSASAMGTSVYSLAVNPVNGDLWLGTEQMGVFRSTDNGMTWTHASPPDQNVDPVNGIRDGNAYGITFDSSGNVLFSSQGGVWKSSQNGNAFSWTNVLANGNTANGHGLGRAAGGEMFYSHNADTTNNSSVECSTDNGSTWTECDSGMPQGLTAHAFVVSPADGKLYAVMQDESTDNAMLYATVNRVQ